MRWNWLAVAALVAVAAFASHFRMMFLTSAQMDKNKASRLGICPFQIRDTVNDSKMSCEAKWVI